VDKYLIDRQKIKTPKVELGPSALRQIRLMTATDFGLAGKQFRIQIDGKVCDGFTYATGFTHTQQDDFIIDCVHSTGVIKIIMNPFTAFYLQDAYLDFIQDYSKNIEGFVVINKNQQEYQGKFWKDHFEKIPPQQSLQDNERA